MDVYLLPDMHGTASIYVGGLGCTLLLKCMLHLHAYRHALCQCACCTWVVHALFAHLYGGCLPHIHTYRHSCGFTCLPRDWDVQVCGLQTYTYWAYIHKYACVHAYRHMLKLEACMWGSDILHCLLYKSTLGGFKPMSKDQACSSTHIYKVHT